MPKKWRLKPQINQEIKEKFPDYHPIILQLLWNRGLTTSKEMDEFLYPDYLHHVDDPFLFRDMDKAVKRLFKAITAQEKITVYGDYDADGVPGSVIIADTLEKLGGKVDIYIPHREKEGYGLNVNAIEYLAKNGTKIIITVDCGISNAAEVATAEKAGINVIITDHHQAPLTLPLAFATLHCGLADETYPFKFFAGGGMAFKLASALLRSDECQWPAKEKEAREKWLLDLVIISTVADMVPLIGENRTLSFFGMIVLRQTKRLGLQKLMSVAGTEPKNMNTYGIGFILAPRINAAGRLDHANVAYQLLKTDDPAKAEELALGLQLTNEQRQRMTENVLAEAREQLGEVKPEQKILIAVNDAWPGGILGLVASRLVNLHHRPVFILNFDGQNYTGSGRSITKFHITDALKRQPEFFVKFGGHPGACGFTLKGDKLEEFKIKMNEVANELLSADDLVPILELDAAIMLSEINWDLLDILDKLEPFGVGNPRPKFLIKKATISSLNGMGKNNQHARVILCDQQQCYQKAVAFNQPTWLNELKIGDKIDLIVELGVNEWNGNREIQMKIIDWRPISKNHAI